VSRPVYSRLLLEASITGGDSDLQLLPDASTYVVRDISWIVASDTGGCSLSVEVNGTGLLRASYPGRTQTSGHWEGRRVAPGPSSVSIGLTGAGSSADVVISGYELTP
jgi:hypothetical protein